MKAVLLILVFASKSLAATYWLEPLVEESATHIAPTPIQRFMAQIEMKRLRECAEAHGFSESVLATYFSAIRIDLGDNAKLTYLVFPSRFGTAFFGAHAISYWLLEQRSDGSLKLLFSGGDDGIKVLSGRSNGLYDIGPFYGKEIGHLRFDGDVYHGKEP